MIVGENTPRTEMMIFSSLTSRVGILKNESSQLTLGSAFLCCANVPRQMSMK